MSKECKHEEWNPCGNDFYSCRKCGILRTSQQVNLYAEKDRQIADLEAKLAKNKKWLASNEGFLENQKLKQQLAEKEKENDELQDKLHSYYEQIMNNGTCGLCEYVRTNYKISFAVEQLEKVKWVVEDVQYTCGDDYNISRDFLIEEIDNQIKQLKEMN